MTIKGPASKDHEVYMSNILINGAIISMAHHNEM
jgi:hypothetical protein